MKWVLIIWVIWPSGGHPKEVRYPMPDQVLCEQQLKNMRITEAVGDGKNDSWFMISHALCAPTP